MATVKIASTLPNNVILSVWTQQSLSEAGGPGPGLSATIIGYGAGQKTNPGPIGMAFTDVDTAFWTQWSQANPRSPLAICIFPVSG